MTDYHLAICPANDDGTIDWQSGDGSGPYKIDRGEFGVSWELSRHDGWHGEGAYFDNLEMIVLNDPNARQTALVTGDVDCGFAGRAEDAGAAPAQPEHEGRQRALGPRSRCRCSATPRPSTT
jgi:ABC-type transport system substrate-binding protein